MPIMMDADALAVFMKDVFKQVADDFAIDHVGETDLTTRLLTADRHLRPGGTVSGPSIFALADVSAYLMTLARIGPKALAVTTNCSIGSPRRGCSSLASCCRFVMCWSIPKGWTTLSRGHR